MKKISVGPLYYEISRHNLPRLTIDPGDTVMVETEDAWSGQVRKEGDRRDKLSVPYSNPQTGPIWISGAERGDTLVIHIENIEPRFGQAVTRVGTTNGLGEWLGLDVPHGTRICPIRDGKIWWSEKVIIPYAPMIGTIGNAPDIGVPPTGPAGPYGGNMDLREVTNGNTLYLPVFIPGALLHVGDVHAAQGAGELCGSALEMAATITITVDLVKGKSIARPRIRSPRELMTVETGLPMEQSIRRAYADLILWLENDYCIPRWDGFNLVTQVGEISIGYANIGTVATKILIDYVESASRDIH